MVIDNKVEIFTFVAAEKKNWNSNFFGIFSHIYAAAEKKNWNSNVQL